MATPTESYPFAEPIGDVIGKGKESIVHELGPNWVMKEFNPLNDNDEPRDPKDYERSQSRQTLRELQETQRILSQNFVFGNKLVPLHIVLGTDPEKHPKYFKVQERMPGSTLEDIITKGEPELSDEEFDRRFKSLFENNPELRPEMIELIWGAKRALLELGVYFDFHTGNIAVDKNGRLKVIDLPNVVHSSSLVYSEGNKHLKSKHKILGKVERHYARLNHYEDLLDVTDEEKLRLDEHFGTGNGKYEQTVEALRKMRDSLPELPPSEKQ